MPHLILLGDSVFDNGPYVPPGHDVGSLLRHLLPVDWMLDVLAEDGATIADVSHQLARVPGGATHVVLSMGGNDVLLRADLLTTPVDSTLDAFKLLSEAVREFANSYERVLKQCLEMGLPTTVCTIYEGNFVDVVVQQATSVALAAFNDAIYRTAVESQVPVVELRSTCSEDTDFINSIEPSVTGGMKIAKMIAYVAISRAHSSASALL